MRRAGVAELVLLLVTTRERAASAVGDLLEERESLLRFWFAVLRTTGGYLCRGLFARPLSTLVLAASSWAVQVMSGYLLYSGPYLLLPLRPNDLTAAVTRIILCTLTPFSIGWSVGKVSKGREVATSFVAAAALPFGIPRYPQISALSESSVLALFALMGAILYRFSVSKGSRSGASHA